MFCQLLASLLLFIWTVCEWIWLDSKIQNPPCFCLLILMSTLLFFLSGSWLVRAEKNTKTGSSGRNERLELESLPLVVLSCFVLVSGYIVLCSHISPSLWDHFANERGLFAYSRWWSCKWKRKEKVTFITKCFYCSSNQAFSGRS